VRFPQIAAGSILSGARLRAGLLRAGGGRPGAPGSRALSDFKSPGRAWPKSGGLLSFTDAEWAQLQLTYLPGTTVSPDPDIELEVKTASPIYRAHALGWSYQPNGTGGIYAYVAAGGQSMGPAYAAGSMAPGGVLESARAPVASGKVTELEYDPADVIERAAGRDSESGPRRADSGSAEGDEDGPSDPPAGRVRAREDREETDLDSSREPREDHVFDLRGDGGEDRGRVLALGWKPLAQRYADGDISEIHLHIGIGGRVAEKYCLVLEWPDAAHFKTSEIGAADFFDLNSVNDAHHERYAAMFVDVGQLVDHPEWMRLGVLPAAIRLEMLDQCRSARRDTRKPVFGQGHLEVGSTGCDRVLQARFDCGFERASRVASREVPNEIVQAGAEVLDGVSEHQRETVRWLPVGYDNELFSVGLRVYLLRNSIRLAVKPPLQGLLESVEVFMRTPQLESVRGSYIHVG
jgi:hypothetical protein